MGDELNEEEKNAIDRLAELDLKLDEEIDDIQELIETYDEIVNDNKGEEA